MQASSKGAGFGQWMLKHEDALKKRTDLPQSEPRRSAVGRDEQPAPPSPRQPDQPSPKKPMGMPEHKVPCFNVSPKHFDRIPEFDRQLAGQQKGLNDLTVDEYLKGREAFTGKGLVRDPKVAKAARVALSTDLETKFRDEFLLEGKLPAKAASLAKEKALRKLSTLAALHNPDLFAGGKDIIDDFGDRRVNSSIGSQWPSRIESLDRAVSSVADPIRSTTKINATLKRCGKE